jgi:hypothetical protein
MNYRIKEPKQVVLHAQGGSGAGFIDGVWHELEPQRRELTCVCGAVWEGETMVHPQPKALVLADALEELDVQFSHTGLCGEAADELRRLHVWEKAYEAVCDERDAIIRDSDKAHALLRWVEKEMRYAGWDIRLNDQHGRTDVYEAIKEFLA